MKNAVLASLFVLSISNAFGIEIEKNGISIKYGTYRTVKIDYRLSALGAPHYITISNHSDAPIIVDASLIKNPLHSSNAIAKEIRDDWKKGALVGAIFMPALGAASYLLLENMIKSPTFKSPTLYPFSLGTEQEKTPYPEYFILGSTAALGSLTAYLLYKLVRETEKVLTTKLEKDVLHSPITIQPGKSVEKLFWLKNPKDQVKIDFDAIKVLK